MDFTVSENAPRQTGNDLGKQKGGGPDDRRRDRGVKSGFLRVGKSLEVRLITFERLRLFADAENFDRRERVAFGDLIHDLLALDDVTEHGMLAVEPRRGFVRDEELTAV